MTLCGFAKLIIFAHITHLRRWEWSFILSSTKIHVQIDKVRTQILLHFLIVHWMCYLETCFFIVRILELHFFFVHSAKKKTCWKYTVFCLLTFSLLQANGSLISYCTCIALANIENIFISFLPLGHGTYFTLKLPWTISFWSEWPENEFVGCIYFCFLVALTNPSIGTQKMT